MYKGRDANPPTLNFDPNILKFDCTIKRREVYTGTENYAVITQVGCLQYLWSLLSKTVAVGQRSYPPPPTQPTYTFYILVYNIEIFGSVEFSVAFAARKKKEVA